MNIDFELNFTCKSNTDFKVKRNNSEVYYNYFKLIRVPSSLFWFLVVTNINKKWKIEF